MTTELFPGPGLPTTSIALAINEVVPLSSEKWQLDREGAIARGGRRRQGCTGRLPIGIRLKELNQLASGIGCKDRASEMRLGTVGDVVTHDAGIIAGLRDSERWGWSLVLIVNETTGLSLWPRALIARARTV